MYQPDAFDREYLAHRSAQFRAQVARRLDGSLSEDEFRPLRLMNGLYLQLHAYMLRVAIPYGTMNPGQLTALAGISERWDRGYGHFTTRQNIQFNWPELRDVPDMLDALARVGLHAIQTSGNTIRNVTADPFAGAAADEIADPRPVAELIRQWSTDHPEFQFLPRKFKIAVTGSPADRAATRAHDIGIRILRRDDGEIGYQILAGGGLGRTPHVAETLRDFLPEADLLPYLEAVVSSYNSLGRRDNKYKARIKITLRETGIDAFREIVERRFAALRPGFPGARAALQRRIAAQFAAPVLETRDLAEFDGALLRDPEFADWTRTNLAPHRDPAHAIVTISLKPHGGVPGDMTADQMRAVAALAERYGHSDIRVHHTQNLILPHVHKADLPLLHAALQAHGLAAANAGLASDIIACPGMDFCALATARSIPVAQEIASQLEARRIERDLGPLSIKISGCINACGHHHLGDIGILGLDRAGVENYQITLGGDAGPAMKIGKRAGPGFPREALIPAIDRLFDTYLALRTGPAERFGDTLVRLGHDPFLSALYPKERAHAA